MLYYLTAAMHLAPLEPSMPSSKVAIPRVSPLRSPGNGRLKRACIECREQKKNATIINHVVVVPVLEWNVYTWTESVRRYKNGCRSWRSRLKLTIGFSLKSSRVSKLAQFGTRCASHHPWRPRPALI
ncbi:hypothetical protein BDW74DRAFT_143362 [Aspergillus multicolor]|uniref:uncharacterized protein n=1 Tax=Aspergillus multicolor TaxID=41759 RepID=UPI003CCD45A3